MKANTKQANQVPSSRSDYYISDRDLLFRASNQLKSLALKKALSKFAMLVLRIMMPAV
jgi:hypothetical protein